ncbi:membrane metallo-endopeptidase-like 1 [Prorops nasuta]|uniref:membrane metallo-endopeptidase-like 1 n=1 Tax=Prorops nasuta TaxID=863751 RepID=UPI0034CF1410
MKINFLYFLFPLIFIIMAVMAADRNPGCNTNEKDYDLCTSPECRLIARELYKSMNFSVNPCVDFYNFMCGMWKVKHPIARHQVLTDALDEVTANIYRRFNEILSDSIVGSTTALDKARRLHKQCLDIKTLNEQGVRPIFSYLNKLGGWPLLKPEAIFYFRNSWQLVHRKGLQTIGILPFFDIGIDQNKLQSHIRIIQISQPTLNLEATKEEDRQQNRNIKNYKKVLQDVAWYFSSKMEESDTNLRMNAEIEEIIKFELALADIRVSRLDSKNVEKIHNIMTIEEFQNFYDLHGGSHSNAKIDWLETINGLFENTAIRVGKKEKIEVRHPDFFRKLPEILKNTRSRIIVNFVVSSYVRHMIYYSDTYLTDIANEYFSRSYLEETAEIERRGTCLTLPTLSKAVSIEYIGRYFPETIKTKARSMVDQILETTVTVLNETQWMDDPTKQISIEKMQNMKKLVGYPDLYRANDIDAYYEDLKLGSSYLESIINLLKHNRLKEFSKLRTPVSRLEWTVEPTVANAFYTNSLNAIIVPAGFLQYPIFKRDRLYVLNYAVAGFIIAHEISHAFDMNGRKFNKNGNFGNWWSRIMYEIHTNISECFVDQYTKFIIEEISGPTKLICVDGKLTLSENIADSAALRIVYRAFKAYQASVGGKDIRLMGLDQYSSDKLLFMQFAQSFCTNMRVGEVSQFITKDCHATPRARVNGAISNHPDFARIFECDEENSPMNPPKKCSIL